MSRAFRRATSIAVFVATVAIVGYLTLVVSAPIRDFAPEYRLRRFFTAQAEALLSGRLWVNPVDGAHECFTSEGHCYGYFGLTPSLLRIPFLSLAPGAGMTDAFVVIALLVATAGCLALVNVAWRSTADTTDPWNSVSARLLFVTALVIAGPGSLVTVLTLPTGYEEAIAWATAFTSWALVALVTWWRTGRDRWLVLALVAFVAASNSRPSAIPVSIAAGVVVVVFLVSRRQWRARSRAGWLALAMIIAPLATTLAVWFAKFGVLVPPLAINDYVRRSSRWAAIMDVNGHHDSWWGFIPTNVVQYLRPDSLEWSGGSLIASRPLHAGVAMLPPLDGVGIFVTPMASVTALVPVLFPLLIILLWRTPRMMTALQGKKSVRLPRIVTFGTLLVAWAAFSLLAINVGVQNRYMGDLVPAVALTAAWGAVAAIPRPGMARGIERAIVITLVLLSVAGVVVSVLHQEWQISRYL